MLIDTTLREGAQLFGAYFPVDTRARIATGLLDLGIDELELGWAGQEGLEELVQILQPSTQGTPLSVWTPCRESDIRVVARLGADRINIGVPVSDLHIEKRLATNRSGLLEKLASTVLSASLLGIKYISVGFEDVSRADHDFALKAARLAADMGASRIRLSDSLGLMTPHEMAKLVEAARETLDTDIAVHCHNDFGMATANALSALHAGANYADVSVLGIGERSGIAATEELAAFLTLKEETHGYSTDALRPLCHLVAVAAGVPISRTKPVAGEDIFACESGIHAHALGKSPDLFEPYAPDAIGAGRRISVGGKSGRAAIVNALDENGLDCPDHRLPALVSAVKQLSWELKRPLTSCELEKLTNNQQ